MSDSKNCTPPAAPPPTPIDMKQKVFDILTPVFSDNGWVVRRTKAGVLQAVCQNTVSFLLLAQCLEACRSASKECSVQVEALLSTIGMELVISVRIGGKRRREEECRQSLKSTEDLRDKIHSTISKLSKTEVTPLPEELARATSVLDNVVCVLKAASGKQERAIQSYGIFFRKLKPSDVRNRIVLAFRLHAGTPVRINDLRHCLGETWEDGAITSGETVNGVDSVVLPLTEEGVLSLEHGNSPIMILTSVKAESSTTSE